MSGKAEYPEILQKQDAEDIALVLSYSRSGFDYLFCHPSTHRIPDRFYRIMLAELFGYFLAFLPNVYISQHANDVGGILYVLWSIGIEIQFYLFVPFIVIAFPKHLVSALLFLVVLHVLASNLFPGIAGHYFNFYYFLAGGIISILSLKDKLEFLRLNVIKLTLIIFSFYFSSPSSYTLPTTYYITLLRHRPQPFLYARSLTFPSLLLKTGY